MSTLLNPAKGEDALENVLWVWLAAGTLAWLVYPPLRVHDALLGWLPFWLIAAPLIDLGLLHRRRLLAAAVVFLRSSVIARIRERASVHALFEKRGYHRVKSCARRLRRDQSLMPRRFFSMRRRNSDMMRRYRSSPR